MKEGIGEGSGVCALPVAPGTERLDLSWVCAERNYGEGGEVGGAACAPLGSTGGGGSRKEASCRREVFQGVSVLFQATQRVHTVKK